MFGTNENGSDNWGIWMWIILILALFNGNGWGNGANGVADNYVLASDFSNISRQISDGFGTTERKIDSVNNGICSLGYDQLAQMNGINQNISNSANMLSSQLAECCCQNRYDSLLNANTTQNAINTGFCQTNFNAQNNTRDIVDANNANTQAILSKLCAMETNAKDERIAELTQQVNHLQLAASQSAQNAYLINQLQPTARPAYIVASPYSTTGYSCPYTSTIA